MQALDPPRGGRVAWYVGWQDVVAMGHLAEHGVPWDERYVALCGPFFTRPRWVRTVPGVHVGDLVAGELEPGACRVVSGSVLTGRQASGWGAWLGRYDSQVSVVPDPTAPRPRGFSYFRVLRRWFPSTLTTARHGDTMPMIPVPAFERIVPLDLVSTALLRALLVGDLQSAEKLGCLELEEEDLALCSYICPAKIDYGALLRQALDALAAERPEVTA